MYGALLVPIIISKLPVETRKSIAREYDSDHITLNNLRKAITKEARILEAGQFTDREGLHTTATFLTEARNKTQRNFNTNNPRFNDKKRPCIYCTGIHFPGDCTIISDVNERLNIVKQKKKCFNCLGNHGVAECKSRNRCKKCNKKHHTSICGEQATDGKGQDSKEKSTVVSLVKTEEPETAVMYTSQHTSVLLKTAIAPISYGKQITEASILFDEGAQRSFITQSIADKLQIRPSGRDTIELSAFGDKEKNIRHLDTATVQLQTDKGADYYWDIVQDHVIRGNGPTAVASKIGYLLSGPVIRNGEKSLTSSILLNVTSHHAEESNIEKFWNLESLGIRLPQQNDEESFVKTYQQDCIKFENERYSAKLPWKLDHPDLPSNIMIAKARTESTIRRLSREPHLLRKYSEIIEDQMKRGFIEKVNDENDNGKSTHYIPHHAVKKDSTTTPIRIVYDCSCKKSPDHASLNDCLMSTPPDLNDLTKILMGFRTKKYAISTGIEKAFLHIGLDEKDRDFTRFFWLSDTDNPSSTLTTYRFKSILFGATSSPFILNATLLKHLDACNTNISAMMKNDVYVDYILSSLENEDDAVKYFVQARSLMSEAGFNLRSWSSNCSKLTDLAKQHDVCEKETFVKILGLKWDTVKDTITFQKVDLFDIELPNITKREILKQSSRIYDPLGLLSSVSVRAKILMQTLWEQKYEWDEPLPLEIQTTWKNLAKDLEKTTYTELKRPYFPNLPDQKTQLHVFVDASTIAYGATVYICNHHESSLVIAKNRVAPLKQLTLPQLELMAALIGARLADHVKSVLHIENITFWSDSQIVLQWLSTSKQLKRFIRNRVTEIRKLTNTQEWRYCPTEDNPADLLTRGLSASQFEQNTLWFNGPEWISDASKWPSWKPNDTTVLLTSTDKEDSSTADKEIDNQQGILQIVQITRYSTLSKLLRITAYLLRFIRNCRSPILQRNKAKYVSREELQDATECWILNCQRTSFQDEMLHLKLKDTKPTVLVRQLRLYLNNKDAICCGGRIHNAPVCENTKFPYLLPRSHHFTKLVVLDIHKYMKHSGVLSTVTQIRQTYWIPRIRQYVRGILRNCVICRKINSKPYTAPDPPPLPKVRLLEAPPFTITGVDFTGALYIRDTRDTEHKVFICLFTCASTRAVHLEVVPDLSEKSFLQAFRRFASRKSRPHTMISDNASTYLAASETLKKLTQSPSLNDTLSTYGTTWRFIPKRAPWYGGWWERFIGITKTCLKKTLGRSYVTMDTLQTILTEIEAIINDRPLTYVSPDIEDEEPLTPSHLLYGRRITLTPYPQPNIEYIAVNSGKQELHKHLNKQSSLMEHFWNRWKSEYITTLREFHRQTGNNLQTIQVGDVVQVQDDKLPKNRWNIAVVDELITGNDGFTRAAIIRTSAGRTSRPIVKLYPLEIRTNINNLDDNNDDSSTERLTRVLPKREASVRARENIEKWTTQK